MLAFAFSYVGAFHEPTPHHVPIAVVGPPAAAVQLNRLPGDPLDARQASSRSDALSQIDDRDVYGAYEVATNRLFVASAANRATAIALEETFNRVAAAQRRPAVRVTDVKPLPPNDPNGTAAFYAVIAWVFGGYIGATLIGLIGSPRSRSRQRAAARIGALAGFGIVAGILSVVMLRASFGVFSGHVVALCAIGGADHLRQRRRHGGHPGRGRPGRDRARHSRLRDPRQHRVGRAVRAAAAPGPVEDDRRCAAARRRASTWRGRRCSSTARGSRARSSCSSVGPPWVLRSRSRSAAASLTQSRSRHRPPQEQRSEQRAAYAQATPSRQFRGGE